MATHYIISVLTNDGETHSDTINSGLRAEVAHWETLFNLGARLFNKKEPNPSGKEFGHTITYTYENGILTVTTRYNQLTEAQRTGRRSYDRL